MKVEITIDRQKKLPDGAVPALEKELLRRLDQNFNNCSLVIRRASSDGLPLMTSSLLGPITRRLCPVGYQLAATSITRQRGRF